MKLWIKKNTFNDRVQYSTRIQDKDKVNDMYLDLQFKQGNEPAENCQIQVKDSFFSCYKAKDSVKPKLIIIDYEVLQTSNFTEQKDVSPKDFEKDVYADFGSSIVLDSSDLPF